MRRTRCLAGLVLLVSMLIGAEARACACAPDSLERGGVEADRIFRGRVLSARVLDSKPRRIQFVIGVEETFRGDVGKRVELRTAMPDDCGPTRDSSRSS